MQKDRFSVSKKDRRQKEYWFINDGDESLIFISAQEKIQFHTHTSSVISKYSRKRKDNLNAPQPAEIDERLSVLNS